VHERRFRRKQAAAAKKARPWYIACTILTVLLFVATIGFAPACKKREEYKPLTPEEERSQLEARREHFNAISSDITYFREARSNLCFAYIFRTFGLSQYAVGGPAMASVDCAKVEHLLINSAPRAESPTAP
jgi:hypothetical protein